jgi:hypothetical protein
MHLTWSCCARRHNGGAHCQSGLCYRPPYRCCNANGHSVLGPFAAWTCLPGGDREGAASSPAEGTHVHGSLALPTPLRTTHLSFRQSVATRLVMSEGSSVPPSWSTCPAQRYSVLQVNKLAFKMILEEDLVEAMLGTSACGPITADSLARVMHCFGPCMQFCAGSGVLTEPSGGAQGRTRPGIELRSGEICNALMSVGSVGYVSSVCSPAWVPP